MNKTNKKGSRRILLIVFTSLIIVLFSWSVMGIDCPASGVANLGDLRLHLLGFGETLGTGVTPGKASVLVEYPGIDLITDSALSYCGYPQIYMFEYIKGRGDSINSVIDPASAMARGFSCNQINRTKYKQLMTSEGPISTKGTMKITEDSVIYDATIRYTIKKDCPGKSSICDERVEERVSCKRDVVKSWAIGRVTSAPNFLNMVKASFSSKIYDLRSSEIDDVYEAGLIDELSPCCTETPETITCYNDSGCGNPVYEPAFCGEGRHVAKNVAIPVCMDAGTSTSSCSVINTIEITEYCPLDQTCLNAVCTSPSSCTSDSDGTEPVPYEVPGYVSTNIYDFKDNCMDEDYVVEYSCQNSLLGYEVHKCTGKKGICENGACVDWLANENQDETITLEEILAYSNNYNAGDVNEAKLKHALKQREKKIKD